MPPFSWTRWGDLLSFQTGLSTRTMLLGFLLAVYPLAQFFGEELVVLNELYLLLRPYTHYFQPTMKLKSKERVASLVKKHYDTAQTPARRLLAYPYEIIPVGTKEGLRAVYQALNPARLIHQIHGLRGELNRLSRVKGEPLRESLGRRE